MSRFGKPVVGLGPIFGKAGNNSLQRPGSRLLCSLGKARGPLKLSRLCDVYSWLCILRLLYMPRAVLTDAGPNVQVRISDDLDFSLCVGHTRGKCSSSGTTAPTIPSRDTTTRGQTHCFDAKSQSRSKVARLLLSSQPCLPRLLREAAVCCFSSLLFIARGPVIQVSTALPCHVIPSGSQSVSAHRAGTFWIRTRVVVRFSNMRSEYATSQHQIRFSSILQQHQRQMGSGAVALNSPNTDLI